MSPTLRSRIEATTHAFLSAYEEGSTHQTASLINRSVTPSCRRFLLPASVPAAFNLPPGFSFDTATYEQTFANDIARLAFTSNVMTNLVIDVEARRASFTSVAGVRTRGGEAYEAETAWFLEFSESGERVTNVVEFCDKDVLLRMAGAGA